MLEHRINNPQVSVQTTCHQVIQWMGCIPGGLRTDPTAEVDRTAYIIVIMHKTNSLRIKSQKHNKKVYRGFLDIHVQPFILFYK